MNILQTLGEGATYAGHPFHIVLNYAVLLLTLIPHLFLWQRGAWGWIALFVLFTVIQVSLWFTSGAVGISLIWCAMAGYNLLLYFRHRKEGLAMAFLFIFSPLVAIGVMVFYYLYFPPITTAAHIMAFLLGLALGLRLQRWYRQKRT